MAEPLNLEPQSAFAPTIRNSYLELFYATLFHPIQTFREIAADPQPDQRLLIQALASVILVSTIAPLVRLADAGGDPGELMLTVPLNAIIGVAAWAFISTAIALLAYAFTGQSRIRTFLTLSGLATLPWILMGPITLIKSSLGLVGLIAGILLILDVWLWSVLLFALALSTTYQMSVQRTLITLIAPLVMALVMLGWVVSLVGNIRQLWPA